MQGCNDNARAAERPTPREAMPWTLLSGRRRDLLLTLLLGLMRFNPQEAMIVRAGMRQAVAAISHLAKRIIPQGMPATVGANGLLPMPHMLALSCLALMLSAGQVAGGIA